MLVIPAFNEQGKVGKVVRGARACGALDRVIVVDDGSGDATSREARRAGALVLRHRRNRGVGAALRTGFAKARKMGGRTLVVMGADDQDRAEEIPRLLAGITAGNDFVQGSRWLRGGRTLNMPLSRSLGTRIYSAFFTALSGRRTTDATNGFRAFRASLLETIDLDARWLDRYELEPYLYWRALRDGHSVKEVPVTKKYPPRGGSYTKMTPLLDWWSIFRPLLLLRLGIKR